MIKTNLKIGQFAWAVIVFALCLLAWNKQTSFDTSIMALLPKYEQNTLVSDVQNEQIANYANHVFIKVSADQQKAARSAVENVAMQLSKLTGIATVTASAGTSLSQMDDLFAYRFSLLSDSVRKNLLEQHYNVERQSALSKLFTPIGAAKVDPIRDPFFLYDDFLLAQKSGVKVKLEKGLLRLTDTAHPSYLLILELHKNPFDLPTQAQIIPLLHSIQQQFSKQNIQVAYSGLILHAAKGAEQAKFEISTIGVGSALGIILIIWLVFRRFGPLFQVLFPVVIGCVVAISVTILCFHKVNLITIAFGAGLVGVAVDYSMHFVCENSLHNEDSVVKRLFPGLLLGLVSSVLAYGGLALTPFPGLQQIAVFSAAGLIAAWLTVLLWLPLITSNTKTQRLSAAVMLNNWKDNSPKLDQHPALATLFVLCLVTMTIALAYFATPQDSIRLLQTSPASLLKEDQSVQKAIGNNINSAFLMVSANKMESLLQEEEQLRTSLDSLVASGALVDYRALTKSLPSRQRQQQNRILVNQLYHAELGTYAKTLGLSETQQTLALQSLSENQSTLTPEKWLSLPISQPSRNLLIHHPSGEYSSVIQLVGHLQKSTIKQLKNIASASPYIDYVDQVEGISNTLARYRVKITDWLLLAYGAISIVLFFRYRLNIWRVILPPLTGSVVALALAVWLNGGYNLFNLVALMLVFGIGLDMGIFLQESKDSPHTWLAVSLSAVTSLLAFGLLALSKTPVLYHFGIIVLPGLSVIWLLSPLMQESQLEKS